LAHHGILGQKWGIRRYQNPNGTLTEAGYLRYGKKHLDANMKQDIRTKKQIDSKHTAAATGVAGIAGAGLSLATGGSLPLSLLATAGTTAAVSSIIHRISTEKLKSNYAKMVAERKKGEDVISSILEQDKKWDAGEKAAEKLKKVDFLTEQNARENIERSKAAADLGLKALQKLGRHTIEDNKITGNDRAWFIYEDQTIGLATIADLINQGKTKQEVKKMIQDAYTSADVNYNNYLEPGIFHLTESGNPTDFIDACYEIKEEEKKKKG
jgi:hypothetical protein